MLDRYEFGRLMGYPKYENVYASQWDVNVDDRLVLFRTYLGNKAICTKLRDVSSVWKVVSNVWMVIDVKTSIDLYYFDLSTDLITRPMRDILARHLTNPTDYQN